MRKENRKLQPCLRQNTVSWYCDSYNEGIVGLVWLVSLYLNLLDIRHSFFSCCL